MNEAGAFLAYVVYEEPSARLEWQQVLGPADAGNPSPRRRLSVVSWLEHDLVLPELLLIIVLFIRINIGGGRKCGHRGVRLIQTFSSKFS